MRNAPTVLMKLIVVSTLVFGATASSYSQAPQQQDQQSTTPPQQQSQSTTQADMLGPLNLTTDQVQKIRTINAELKDERQAANFRLRTAQRALAEAIQSPNPDETLISQRSKEVADAQANTIRLRSLTEARILQVLSQEQRVKLRMLRQQAGMRRGNQQVPRILGRPNALQRNQNQNQNPNGLTPKQQRRLMRQQQRRP